LKRLYLKIDAHDFAGFKITGVRPAVGEGVNAHIAVHVFAVFFNKVAFAVNLAGVDEIVVEAAAVAFAVRPAVIAAALSFVVYKLPS